MKKILFAVAALAALTLSACGSGDQNKDAKDSDTVILVETTAVAVPDTVEGDSVVMAVAAETQVAAEAVPADGAAKK